ncbi:MAG: TerC family protein [Pyrinomonadaceae bacterium]|nr:TerC family protein [Pyrinomonadaceae bacterium]MCX7639826.1 TerC family protein [Pyrinomonadaceae bacterium]MDW8305350.1 TerC family protein [Acidobacteriota bacterium]
MESIQYPFWAWLVFFAVVFAALGIDLGIVNRKSHVPTKREVFAWSAIWVSLALSFNLFIYWMINAHFGNHKLALIKTQEYLTGYLIELSLSVDNLFVFLLIFSYFKVPKEYQHRVLFWGIMGALMMRMVMIFAGAELVEQFHWVIYVFGIFLIYTAVKILAGKDEEFDPEKSTLVSFITRFVRISKRYEKDRFFIRKSGKLMGTLLFLVLIVVEASDLIFAVDSIPAIFGVTTDRFIVYTSNIFAILGLRTFFFLLSNIVDKFYYLKYGLSFVLGFIGIKMLLPLVAELIIWTGLTNARAMQFLQDFLDKKYNEHLITISLSVVVFTLLASILLSLLFPPEAVREGSSRG